MTKPERVPDSLQGEHPGLDGSHPLSWVRDKLARASGQNKGLAEGDELHAIISDRLPGDGIKPIYKGRLGDLFIGRPTDENGQPSDTSVEIRLKDTATDQPENHMLRNGIILSLAALATGTSVYVAKKHMRVKSKK